MKLLILIALSIIFSPLIAFLETYVFDDWEFLLFLLILITGDTILGFINAWQKHLLHSKGFGQILWKLFAYCSVLIVTHVLTHYRVDGVQNYIFLWFDDTAYAAMVLREAISILENIGLIYPGLVPKWILSRLKQMNLTGKLENSD